MNERIQTEMARLGHAFFTKGKFNLNLIGLRAASDQANLFDDTFVAAYKDRNSVWVVERWSFTSDPGRPHLENPMRTAGCAIMVPGQYRGVYVIGAHKGNPALRQDGDVKVWRDNDKNHVLQRGGKIYVADKTSGINIHRAGVDSPKVELWSAGCQVFKRQADHAAMMALAAKQVAEWGETGKRFSYTLIDVGDHPALADLLL
jgi:hypothetical protein